MTANILFVGFGHMGQAVAGGLRREETQHVLQAVSPPNEETEKAAEALQVRLHHNPSDITDTPDVVVFAVKPQAAEIVVPKYQWLVGQNTLFLSVMAGITLEKISGWLAPRDQDLSLIRAMPNMPASIGHGMTALYAGYNTMEDDKVLAEAAMQAIGDIVWLPQEELMHAVTAISGSGPAWFFLLIEALAEAAEAQGVPADLAKKLAIQTAKGAGVLASQSHDPVAVLRENVTSPGGTTEAGLQVLMEEDKFKALIQKAINAATRRSRDLG